MIPTRLRSSVSPDSHRQRSSLPVATEDIRDHRRDHLQMAYERVQTIFKSANFADPVSSRWLECGVVQRERCRPVQLAVVPSQFKSDVSPVSQAFNAIRHLVRSKDFIKSRGVTTACLLWDEAQKSLVALQYSCNSLSAMVPMETSGETQPVQAGQERSS